MTAAARARCGLRLAACLVLVAISGCGDDKTPPEIRLLTATRWLNDPGSIDEVGYEVHVDIGWPAGGLPAFRSRPICA